MPRRRKPVKPDLPPEHCGPGGEYLPPPDLIKAATEAIRKNWPDSEFYRRAGVEVPSVETAVIPSSFAWEGFR